MRPNELITLNRSGATLIGEAMGEGRDVLLLHAGGESRVVWHPVMAPLAARSFRSLAFDQRGHGESGGSPADGIVACGDDAKAMIGLMQRPLVVGASLGGFALMLALETLEAEVAGLVLVDVIPAPDPEKTRAYLAQRTELGNSPFVEDILSRGERLTGIVGALSLPMLLVCGGARSPLGAEDRARFLTAAPHARVETIEEASHLVARDAPAKLAELIADFGDSIGTGSC